MKRIFLTLTAALAAALCLAPTALAAPRVGIGEQNPAMFADPQWKALGVKDVRVIAGWDALHYGWQRAELDAYMQAAHAAGANVMLGFGHAREERRHKILPSTARFTREFEAFRARYPWVREFVTWNEANHCSQPTCKRPEQAARYFDAIRKHCSGCTVVAADVLDASTMPAWVKRFRRATKARRVIWGLHNYIDANRFHTTGTRSLLRAVKGDVWFTETGGLVSRREGSSIAFPGSVSHAADSTRWVFKLAALSSRVKRLYFYHWAPSTSADPTTWDSALIDRHGRPRPSYDVLRRWVLSHRPAA